MIGYIYLTTNLINGKIYIGQHKKEYFDTKYFGSGKLLLDALKKYGKENFKCEILCECFTEEELNEKEIYYIKEYKSKITDNGYNMSDGGYVPRLSGELNGNYGKHRPHTDAEKHHLSKIGKGHPPTGPKHHTEDTKRKISISSSRQVHTKERDKIVSKKLTGSKFMTNGLEQCWVLKDDIETKLKLGWTFGSCKKRKKKIKTEKSIQANIQNSLRLKNTVWVNKNTIKKQIPEDELEKYLNEGYKKGMK